MGGHDELEPENIDLAKTPWHGAVVRTWDQFCSTTSIHGLKFIREKDTNLLVKSIWVVIIVTMFGCSFAMLTTFYLDYQDNPTRINVENDYATISQLHFPAVTICPEVIFDTQKFITYVKTLKIPPHVSLADVVSSIPINYGFLNDDNAFEMDQLKLMQDILNLNNLTIVEFIQQIRWDCKDFLYRCRFQMKIVDCDELFQISRTTYGYCCSFNLIQSELNFTDKYAMGGWRDGLSIMLFYNNISSGLSRSLSEGFKVLIHENSAFPSSYATTKFVQHNEESFITIRPVQTFSSDDVKELSFVERQCFLASEYNLVYFSTFEGSNCELDCRAKKMVDLCGCRTYYFHNNRTEERVCSYVDIPCLTEKFTDIIGRYRNTQCTCPNRCEKIELDVQESSSLINIEVPSVDGFYDGIQPGFSVAHIFMNSHVYRRIQHDLLYTMAALISNLGSAITLFVGMSLVSVVEIFYYVLVVFRRFHAQEIKARQKILFRKRTPELKQSTGDGHKY